MRLKLKSDTFFIPMGDHLYLRNNEKSLAMKGKVLASWLERLAPDLDGQHDLTDICLTFPEEKRPLLRQFLLALVEHGYLKNTENDRPHTLSSELIAAYGPAITFIDAHTDSGGYRFEQFLSTPVLAIASGDCLLALAHALLETGNRAISLLDTEEEETNYERLQEILEEQQERDRNLHYTLLPGSAWRDETELARLCNSANTVLYFSTTTTAPEHAIRLAGYCWQAGVSFLPAVILQHEIHIGPFQRPGVPGCWQCYWRRYQSAHGRPAYTTEGTLAVPDISLSVPCIGKPARGIVANMQAFEFFKGATDVRKNTLDGMVRTVELERLQTVKHLLFPHPLCTLCSAPSTDLISGEGTLADVLRLVERVEGDERQDERQIDEWIDENSGLFACVDDEDYHQLPLVRSQVRVPLNSDCAYTLPVVRAAGLDYPVVYMNLARQAACRYLTSLNDGRRALRGNYQAMQSEAVHPAALAGWLGERESAQAETLVWVRGVQLAPSHNLRSILFPGAALAPYSAWNRGQNGLLFEPGAGATSLAPSWPQALAEGLNELAFTLAVSLPERQPGATFLPACLAPATYNSDALCASYLTMLEILDAQVDLLDCSPLPGIPGVVLLVNGHYIGLSVHWNTLCAIRQALQQAVLAIQVERTPGPGERVEQNYEYIQSTDKGKETWQNLPVITSLRPSLAEASNYAEAWRALVTCLNALGWRIIVAPLTRDKALERIWPCAIRLLAARQEREEG